MTISKAMPLALLLIAALFPAALQAQYGLKTVNTLKEYRSLMAADPNQEIVNLREAIPGITLDIRYATVNNLMHRPMYHTAAAFLRLPAAQALLAVQQELQPMG